MNEPTPELCKFWFLLTKLCNFWATVFIQNFVLILFCINGALNVSIKCRLCNGGYDDFPGAHWKAQRRRSASSGVECLNFGFVRIAFRFVLTACVAQNVSHWQCTWSKASPFVHSFIHLRVCQCRLSVLEHPFVGLCVLNTSISGSCVSISS